MRYIPAALQTHLEGSLRKLAVCVKVTTRDGTIYGWTSHDANLVVSGRTYRSAVGCDLGSLRFSGGLQEDASSIVGLISSDTGGATSANLLAGYFNGARVEVFLVNWADLTMGTIPLKYGRILRIVPDGSEFEAEIQDLTSRLLAAEVCETYGPDCAADLGDSRCGVSIAVYSGTLDSVTDERTVTDSTFVEPADPTDLIGGRFVFTTGSLQHFQNEISAYDSGTKTFTLALPFPSTPLSGWTFRAYEGCDKSFTTCKDRFSNAANFRGFPHAPDRDALNKGSVPAGGGYQTGGS